MNDFAKGSIVVLGPEEGESFWQPLPSTGYIVNKLTPYNTPYDSFSLGIQVLEPGAHIRRHAHELFSRQDAKKLLDRVSEENPKVVEDLVPKLLPLAVVQRVLQNLLRERVSIRDGSSISL